MVGRTAATLLASVVFGLLSTGVTLAEDYDLVILNGRVMDPETSFDETANVGVKDGRIVAITNKVITGRKPSMPRASLWLPASLTRISTGPARLVTS